MRYYKSFATTADETDIAKIVSCSDYSLGTALFALITGTSIISTGKTWGGLLGKGDTASTGLGLFGLGVGFFILYEKYVAKICDEPTV